MRQVGNAIHQMSGRIIHCVEFLTLASAAKCKNGLNTRAGPAQNIPKIAPRGKRAGAEAYVNGILVDREIWEAIQQFYRL